MARIEYLAGGLAVVLIFIGVKMLCESFIHIPILVSLLVVAAILSTSIAASLLVRRKNTHG